jgi:hypothetical protein
MAVSIAIPITTAVMIGVWVDSLARWPGVPVVVTPVIAVPVARAIAVHTMTIMVVMLLLAAYGQECRQSQAGYS